MDGGPVDGGAVAGGGMLVAGAVVVGAVVVGAVVAGVELAVVVTGWFDPPPLLLVPQPPAATPITTTAAKRAERSGIGSLYPPLPSSASSTGWRPSSATRHSPRRRLNEGAAKTATMDTSNQTPATAGSQARAPVG